MRSIMGLAAVVALVTVVGVKAEEKMVSSVHDFTMEAADGKPYALSQHKGHALLIVNVASKCGLTPQYKGLQALYDKYKEKGLTVIGIPANEFGAQEPGTNAEIQTFCSTKYHVTFPVLAKQVVKGEKICPLYKYLTTEKKGDIGWNFAKFLVDKDGKVLERFDPKTTPEDPKLVAAVEKALGEKK
jgi:glutathione peroxidase